VKYSVIAAALLIAGCSGSKETSATSTSTSTGTTETGGYERTFVPSDHDPESNASPGQTGVNRTGAADVLDSTGIAASETIQGYRVQLLATTNIDEVTTRKAMLEEAFPTEWFYIEFDPPVYKLRAGNFPTRFEADRFARTLATKGFPDAWSVPERVFKSPPPLPQKPALSVPGTDSSAAKQ